MGFFFPSRSGGVLLFWISLTPSPPTVSYCFYCILSHATIACARIFQTRRPVFPINPVFTASAPTAQTRSVFCVRSKPSRVRRKFNLAFCAGLNEQLFQPDFLPHITASCLSAAFSALSSFCIGERKSTRLNS